MEALMAYLHYLTILLTAAFLTAEVIVCREGMTAADVRRLPRLDVIFFVAALGTLVTGVLRLFFYAKSVSFYLPNPFFILKMALWLAIAAISIKPTLLFMRWRRALAGDGALPHATQISAVRRLIHVELLLLALMPLMAVLMARGIGR
jgi:putative membrane protein